MTVAYEKNKKMNVLKAASIAIGALTLTAVAGAVSYGQEVLQRIEATVNDEIISAYDLTQRMGLVLAATGGVQNEEEFARLKDQVLRSMVDERLQLQEAAEFELEIEDAEIESAFARIAQNVQQTPEEFEQYLLQAGTTKETLMNQLRAEFAWQQLVNGRLGSQVVVSEEDVEDRLQRMQDNAGKFEYRISEIFIIMDDPSSARLIEQAAQRVVSQLQQGAPFNAMARQFSEAASAARGGDMGWVSEDQLMPEIKQALQGVEVGGVAGPIRTPGGYYVISMTDRRRILSADPMDVEIELKQIGHLFTASTTQEEAEAWLINANQIATTVNSCDQADSFAEQIGDATVTDAGVLPLRQLNVQLRPVLVNLEIGKPSEAIITQDGVLYFMICSRTEPEVRMPTFDEIMGQLEQQRLAMMSRRYLRDLRRDAIVDYK